MRLGKIGRSFFVVNVALWTLGMITLVGCCAKQVPPIRTPIESGANPHPYQSAVFIEVSAIPDDDRKKEIGEVMYDMLIGGFDSRGSGIVIEHGDETRVLTAGHVCEDPRPEVNSLVAGYKLKLYDWEGNASTATVLDVDHSKDLCLLQIDEKLNATSVNIAEQEPKVGHQLFLTAYPLGVYIPKAPTMWDGYFSGTAPDGYYVMTVPVAPGSSGGGVVNNHGELVSIVAAGIVDWEETSLGTSLPMIVEFLSK